MSYTLHISYATKNKDSRPNQDNCMVDKYLKSISMLPYASGEIVVDSSEKRLFLVSDGAGGTSEGEKASEITVNTIFSYLDSIKSINRDTVLKNAIDDANVKVAEYFENIGNIGAATLTGLFFSGDSVISFNAGDSPVFLLNNGELERIHKEHTLAAEKYGASGLQKAGEDANTITHYMGKRGVSGSEQTFFKRIDIVNKMVFLIASDGVEKGLTDKSIKKILSTKKSKTAQTLVEKAYRNGAGDDITAIVIRVIIN